MNVFVAIIQNESIFYSSNHLIPRVFSTFEKAEAYMFSEGFQTDGYFYFEADTRSGRTGEIYEVGLDIWEP